MPVSSLFPHPSRNILANWLVYVYKVIGICQYQSYVGYDFEFVFSCLDPAEDWNFFYKLTSLVSGIQYLFFISREILACLAHSDNTMLFQIIRQVHKGLNNKFMTFESSIYSSQFQHAQWSHDALSRPLSNCIFKARLRPWENKWKNCRLPT